MKLRTSVLAAAAVALLPAFAQTSKPTIKAIADQGIILKISDNGQWGLMQLQGPEGGIAPGGGYVYNLNTLQKTDISHSSGLSGVADITDDGTIIVGEAANRPAYYSTVQGEWVGLPMPTGATGGRLNAVTPDGHYAAGYLTMRPMDSDQQFDSYIPVMYDLTTRTRIDLPNMPELDMQHENKHMVMVESISPDGRYLVGRVSQSYVMPPGLFSFVYDRETSSYTPIGFTENQTGAWTPTVPNTHYCDFPFMSPNGEWIVGTAYMVEPVAGSEWPKEYQAVYRYNVNTKEYICYNANGSEENVDGVSMLNDGTVVVSSPSNNPCADAFVRYGKYYVSFDQIMKQNYGINMAEVTGWDNTGKIICASADGKTLVTMTSPQTCYVIHMPETLPELAAKVDLLANYSVTPAEGTVMSKLKTFKVRFDRDIATTKQASNITFKSEDGTESYTALSAQVSSDASTTLSITFRTRQLRENQKYTLTIPEGMVIVKGDNDVAAKEINLSYVGHDDTPVKLVTAYPAQDASVAYLDVTNNPMLLTFDADVTLNTSVQAYLYLEGEDQPIAPLNIATGGKNAMLYPASRVNLFEGSDYRVEIPAGAFTDITGGCASEAITLNYHGSYQRQVNPDDVYIFNETCDNYEMFMFYEGDHNKPGTDAYYWDFTADTTPWKVMRESVDSSDMCFGSHSMYNPAGKSNDWVMTCQLFIPDESVYLSFDAQSYLNSKTDVLKVIVYQNDKVYNTLTESLVAQVEADGDVVFDRALSPGASEEGLSGEWENVMIPLDKYAGKDIYIAFVNQNEDQSAIFIDNIQVVRDLHYLVTFQNSNRVVNQSTIPVRGTITVASDVEVFNTLDMTLRDGAGNEIDKISETGLNLKKGDSYNFTFTKPLPLVAGESNKYTVDVTLNETTSHASGEVKNLVFEPYKKVVVEEYSGRDCANCPRGFLAMENLKHIYGNHVIPVIMRTYQGDPLGTSVTGYSNYLGLPSVGAPSARINRSEGVYPTVEVNGVWKYTGEADGGVCWQDVFAAEMAEPAEVAIEFSSKFDAETRTAKVETTTKNALNVSGANINIFAVVLENGVDAGYQQNGHANQEDPFFGEWGKGGKYGSAYVLPFYMDEVARTTWGLTYNGTGGLIPADIEAGKEYDNTLDIYLPDAVKVPENCDIVVMLIDAVSGKILNANICPINGNTWEDGVEGVAADGAEVRILAAGGEIIALGADRVEAYSVAGQLLGINEGNGVASLSLDAQGIVIVRAIDAKGNVTVAKVRI